MNMTQKWRGREDKELEGRIEAEERWGPEWEILATVISFRSYLQCSRVCRDEVCPRLLVSSVQRQPFISAKDCALRTHARPYNSGSGNYPRIRASPPSYCSSVYLSVHEQCGELCFIASGGAKSDWDQHG